MSNKPITVPDREIQDAANVGDYDLICQMRKTPPVLYGIFLNVVRQFYSKVENMPRLAPDGTYWSADVDQTKMWIDTELRWEDEHPEFRPAIYVALSPITYHSLTGRNDGKIGEDLTCGEVDFTRSGSGTVSFVHIGATDGESCALASATLDYLDAFSWVIKDDFCFTTLALTQVDPKARRQRESNERYGSIVTLSYEFQDTWSLKIESQVLKKFTFNAGQGLLRGDIFIT
jgi:hypothetical protein